MGVKSKSMYVMRLSDHKRETCASFNFTAVDTAAQYEF